MRITDILLIAALLACSAFFSASEIAFSSLNPLRLKREAETGARGAARAKRVYERFDTALSAILIGNNLVNIAASSLATSIAIALAGEAYVTLAGLVMTCLILVFGEISPKILAQHRAQDFAKVAAGPLTVLMTLLKPVSALVVRIVGALSRLWRGEEAPQPSITEEELSAILDTVGDEGVLDEDTTELMQSALEFDDTTLREVMTPRTEVVALDLDDSPEEMTRIVLDAQFSRVPVFEDSIDRIVGVLPVNHYLRALAETGSADVRALMAEPLFLHQTMTLSDAMKRLQGARTHLAVVPDEFGGTLGIVTMEDLLEQLVGEIWDESDDIEVDFREVAPGVYQCGGLTSLRDFFDEIDYEPPDFDSEYTTLGGWAIEMLDAQPAEGKSFSLGRISAVVEKMDGTRVDRLRVELAPEAEATDDP